MNSALPGPSQEFVPDHLVCPILVTLFCCLPLGIVSIVHASQVDGRRAAGDITGARESARKARLWAIWSAIAGPLLIAAWILFMGGLATVLAISSAH